MSRWWWSLMLVGLLGLGSSVAVAKRLGSGTSVGKQSGQVARPSTAPVSAAPTASPSASVGSPAGGAPIAQQRSWGSMLGGVATGLGLAWLASSLGLGEGFAQVLLLSVMALVALALFRALTRRSTPALAMPGVYASAEAGGPVPVPRGYSPKNVGNDASARPWENQAVSPADGAMSGAALVGPAPWGVPEGFDTTAFLQASKSNFVSLQAAWDRADIPSLRAMLTDGMLAEIRSQLVEREHSGAGDNKTEVVMLEARLLGIEELASDYMASVEFSGLIREDTSAGPNPFREVWNITRPKSNASGWLVAGVQALQ